MLVSSSCCVSLFGFLSYIGLFSLVRRIFSSKLDGCHSKGAISDVSVKTVTLCQGILSSIVGLLTMNACKDIMKDRYQYLHLYATFTWPYFVYDLWAMYETHVLDNPQIGDKSCLEKVFHFVMARKTMVVHHVVLPFLFYPTFFYWRRGLGDYFVGCFLLFEMSLPFVSMRFILIRLQMKDGLLYILVGLAMVIVFGIARILIFPFLYVKYAIYSGIPVLQVPQRIPLKCNLGCLLLASFQAYWFALMVRGLFRVAGKLIRRYKSEHKSEHKSGQKSE